MWSGISISKNFPHMYVYVWYVCACIKRENLIGLFLIYLLSHSAKQNTFLEI